MGERVELSDTGDFKAAWERFTNQNGIHHTVGILGGSVSELRGVGDELQERHREVLEERVHLVTREFLGPLRNHGIAVLTSGTSGGVPGIASSEASSMGLPLVHMHPVMAHRYLNSESEPDLEICVLPSTTEISSWGDETSALIALVDAVVLVGGGFGTLIEIAHALKINESRIRRGERPIYMVAIHDFGGFGDRLHDICSPHLRRDCIPPERIYLGGDAAKFVLQRLNADEIYLD